MCKLLILTKTEQIQRSGRLTDLISHAARLVGSTELDGFGYALGDRTTGRALTERSLAVGKHYVPGLTYGPDGAVTVRRRLTAPPFLIPREESEADAAGLQTVSAGPLVMHGRTSTNVDGLINTHPMRVKDTVLCHNGVVTYDGPKYRKRTTKEGLKHGIRNNIDDRS